MIDLHCHILHGIDDGPLALEESLDMCRIAHADGIRIIVATPHFRPGTFNNNGVVTIRRVAELNEELQKRNVPVTVLAGADVTVSPELHVQLDADRGLFLNGTGKYFLAELPHETIPRNWDQFLLSLRHRGITPIITHPERNRWFLSHPDALVPFVMSGGMVQITAMSITGGMGDETRQYCLSLLRRNLIHVIASDAHDTFRRPPILSEAVKAAAAVTGYDRALRFVKDIPQSIIEGRTAELSDAVVIAPEKKKWYQRILDL